VGSSRKSFVQAVAAGTNPDGGVPQRSRSARCAAAYWPMMERRVGTRHGASLLSGDAAAVVSAILAGAHIVRVHEVDAILPAVRIADAVLEAGGQKGR